MEPWLENIKQIVCALSSQKDDKLHYKVTLAVASEH